MLVQSAYNYLYKKPLPGLTDYLTIDDWNCVPISSKTIAIDEAFFCEAFEAITESLVPIFSVPQPQGHDGDELTVKICSAEGHRCMFRLWAPRFVEDNRYKTNNVYQMFMQVLEKAGLTDWYNER